jgi:myo-inositol 2-dehydrogenase / D-chiro-inositol 1-dehydrogenase
MRAATHGIGAGRLRRTRLGLAGLGRIGLLHATNLTGRVTSAALVRVVDADESLARATGDRLGADWGTSYEDLVADPEVDAVVIATPTPLHVEMIEQAAANGKHVFCEKPISLDLASTLQAIAAAREAGIALQVGLHRRFDPDWAAAAERIRAGELGDIYFFRTTLRDKQPPSFDYIRESGGFFIDVTIHDLDTARWLVGEIEEVTAFGAALSDPKFAEIADVDNAVVVLRFAGGGLGVIDESRVAGYGYECSTEVVGSRSTVRIGGHRRVNDVWLTPGSAAVDWVDDFTERFPDAYALELESFATAILEGRPPAVSGEDALAAFVLAQTCERSFREGRTVQLRREELLGRVSYEAA